LSFFKRSDNTLMIFSKKGDQRFILVIKISLGVTKISRLSWLTNSALARV
jgi:hypothetical protein